MQFAPAAAQVTLKTDHAMQLAPNAKMAIISIMANAANATRCARLAMEKLKMTALYVLMDIISLIENARLAILHAKLATLYPHNALLVIQATTLKVIKVAENAIQHVENAKAQTNSAQTAAITNFYMKAHATTIVMKLAMDLALLLTINVISAIYQTA